MYTQDCALRAREVFEQEAAALQTTGSRLGEQFSQTIDAILACQGRVVLTGMGKHGIVARKIAATLASTGTPAFFMHAAEASHGDLGMIGSADLVIAVSNSGNTMEVVSLIPYLKRNGNLLVGMTGNLKSELARHSDLILDISVDREVCPLNLAPTTSTTAALVMGDAIAVVLLERRGFQQEDFALRHPSGTLGKRLLLKVGDLIKSSSNPIVLDTVDFGTAVAEMTQHKLGAVSIVGADGRLTGVFTDGDLRRTLQKAAGDNRQTVAGVFSRPISEFMTPNPVRVSPDMLAAKALAIMEDVKKKIFVLPVVNEAGLPVGMVHLHDLVSAGV